MAYQRFTATEPKFIPLTEKQLECVSGGLKAQWMDEAQPAKG